MSLSTSQYDQLFEQSAQVPTAQDNGLYRFLPWLYALLRATSYRESGWKADARNPKGTATGLFQTTWPVVKMYNKAHPKNLAVSLADLTHPGTAARVAVWHILTIVNRLMKAGLSFKGTEPEHLMLLVGSYVFGDSLLPQIVGMFIRAKKQPLFKDVLKYAVDNNDTVASYVDEAGLKHVVNVVSDTLREIPKAPKVEDSFVAGDALPILRKGHTGKAVAQLQVMLTAAGFGLKSDGLFGENTAKAVKAFQAAKGLKPDGAVGPLTWKALGNPEPVLQPDPVFALDNERSKAEAAKRMAAIHQFESPHVDASQAEAAKRRAAVHQFENPHVDASQAEATKKAAVAPYEQIKREAEAARQATEAQTRTVQAELKARKEAAKADEDKRKEILAAAEKARRQAEDALKQQRRAEQEQQRAIDEARRFQAQNSQQEASLTDVKPPQLFTEPKEQFAQIQVIPTAEQSKAADKAIDTVISKAQKAAAKGKIAPAEFVKLRDHWQTYKLKRRNGEFTHAQLALFDDFTRRMDNQFNKVLSTTKFATAALAVTVVGGLVLWGIATH